METILSHKKQHGKQITFDKLVKAMAKPFGDLWYIESMNTLAICSSFIDGFTQLSNLVEVKLERAEILYEIAQSCASTS